MKNMLRHSIPAGAWERLRLPGVTDDQQRAWFNPTRHLQVIETLETHEDGREWYHVSATRRLGEWTFELPDWDDMKLVWATFIGEDHVAYQVFPRKRDWINIHEYVLHLWHCPEEEDLLPNFGAKGAI